MTNYKQLPFISKVKENQQAFGEKVISIANDLGISPNWLMIVMNNESGLNPKADNPTSSATGLIQFMASTAKGLGTSTEALLQMSNVQQLDYVKKYYQTYKGKINSAADAYLAVFYPAALGKSDSWAFPTYVVSANKIFDITKDGILTKGEFNQYVNQKYAAYLNNEIEFEFNLKKKSKSRL